MSSQQFKVTDLSSANWCFKKIYQLQNKQKEIDEFADKEIKIIEDYRKREIEAIEKDIEHFKILIQMYVTEKMEENPKYKLSVPYGIASFGKEQVKITYDDNAMLEFVKNNHMDNFITTNVTEKLNKKEFNNYLKVTEDGQVVTEDGEILENIQVEKFRNFNLKIKAEEE